MRGEREVEFRSFRSPTSTAAASTAAASDSPAATARYRLPPTEFSHQVHLDFDRDRSYYPTSLSTTHALRSSLHTMDIWAQAHNMLIYEETSRVLFVTSSPTCVEQECSTVSVVLLAKDAAAADDNQEYPPPIRRPPIAFLIGAAKLRVQGGVGGLEAAIDDRRREGRAGCVGRKGPGVRCAGRRRWRGRRGRR